MMMMMMYICYWPTDDEPTALYCDAELYLLTIPARRIITSSAYYQHYCYLNYNTASGNNDDDDDDDDDPG